MNRKTRRAERIRARLRAMSLRDALVFGIPALALVVGAFWFAAQFIRPAPPRDVVMSTGSPGGAYEMFAARYAPILERNGIELLARPSAGALENLQRLKEPEGEVDVAFVQGGLAMGDSDPNLVSLGSFYLEPLWVFHRAGRGYERLVEMKGARIAIGGEGSGTRQLALDLLSANGITSANARLSPLGGLAAVQALSQGKLDVIFLVGTAQSPAVWSALYTEPLRLMNFQQADAYVRRFPYLSKLELPRGAIDLVRDVPDRDVQLVAPTATLVAREDIHPALIDLLLQAASEVHGNPDLFQRAGEFPNKEQVDYPLSKEADRYYKSGVSFLQRYLPFWAATLIDRMIVLLIPLFAVLFPLFKILPAVYAWRMRARIYRWYGELKFLESEIEESPEPHRAEWLAQLAHLEEVANHIPTPLAYANQLYNLKEHIGLVRSRVLERSAA